jgi:hypothetical protein
MVFSNLNVAACDEIGAQIPRLQESLATELVRRAEAAGYDPEGVVIETQWGNQWKLHRVDGGWNISPHP